jgi:hypothetical protein
MYAANSREKLKRHVQLRLVVSKIWLINYAKFNEDARMKHIEQKHAIIALQVKH